MSRPHLRPLSSIALHKVGRSIWFLTLVAQQTTLREWFGSMDALSVVAFVNAQLAAAAVREGEREGERDREGKKERELRN